MKSKEGLSLEMLELIKKNEREVKFWQRLEEIGFEVTRDVIAGMSHIKHHDLPIRHSFYLDRQKLEIKKMTVELGVWLQAEDGTSNIMTLENFIKCMIFNIRKTTAEVLEKLDSVVL